MSVLTEIRDGVMILTLNRPEAGNSLNPAVGAGIVAAIDEANSNPAVRTLIVTGAGDSFCSGMDVEELRRLTTLTQVEGLEASRRIAKMFRQLHSFPKPLIMAVNGAAVAGGCGIASLGDFTLAVPEARFGYPEARIGFIPAIVSVFLIRQVGEKRARDLLLSGRLIDAQEAREIGIVTEVIPRDQLMDKVRELAEHLLELSPTSLLFMKRLLRELSETDINREIELAIQENTRIRSTPDFHEGITAFLEKRKPRWRG